MAKLTDARIRALKPAARDQWIGDGNGLWLRVRTTGLKTFVLRTKRGGRTKVTTLGDWPTVTLLKARLEAANARADRAGHVLRPEAVPLTVKELTEEFYQRRIAGRYRRTANVTVYRDRLIEQLGWRKLSEVRAPDLAAMAQEYAEHAPVAANRFLSFCKLVFAYGVQTGRIEASPADKLTSAVAGGIETPRARVLSDAELRLLWHAQSDHTRLLRFLLLTGARIGEAQRASWKHIDATGRTWTIPAAHSKNARDHWVHLPDATLAVLGPAGAPGSLALRSASETAVQAWMRRWCEREKIADRFTPHDLRRTFVSRLGELGAAPHVIQLCVNHTVVEGTLAVYLRAEFERERRQATDTWAKALLAIVDR